jgi:membrane-associated phospholipid phosphatase
MAGHFPSLGTYFSSHLEALAPPGWTDGLFYQLVAGAQEAGERPTAAFPSSHIGISTIVLILARRHAPRLLFLFLPLWALLCCATVYIRAHYLVDAIAGLISAPIILWLAEKIIGGGGESGEGQCPEIDTL